MEDGPTVAADPAATSVGGGTGRTRVQAMAERAVDSSIGAASGVDRAQREAPYLEALLEYARRDPGRFHVPGHKGGQGGDPALVEAIGLAAFELDVPAGIAGIAVGPASP